MSSSTSQPAATATAAPTAGKSGARLAVIYGSVREGRFGPVVGDWFTGVAKQHGSFAEVDVIDLADHELPLSFPAYGSEPPPKTARVLEELSGRLDAADAFVVVTPEYNHSFPASLKNAIDWFHGEWQAKPVGFVAYGGVSGGLRAVEHLRPVFAELHSVTIRDALSFANAGDLFGADGLPKNLEGSRLAAKGLLNQLDWWADALREARAKSPYGAAA
ncbi:NAD(P)H-dependent oxidoreductase [Streptomyces sp. N2-109]|uniref:NAD(P)H-dependent oxidoreductase n=1 Tax=Streptomyces gossypii TaxID=2883101 RepID=A0ABT2JYS9_9ACTN|nr:NAD(P)H-dependent oxidoreductase [Streptomyces gossypii]MCT2592818.1 NAD(P)H-dependent oxidoreductase [Streptomyces gossypii]